MPFGEGGAFFALTHMNQKILNTLRISFFLGTIIILIASITAMIIAPEMWKFLAAPCLVSIWAIYRAVYWYKYVR